MIRQNRRERIRLVRQAVESMSRESMEYAVSLCYMRNYSEIDIRDELFLQKRILTKTKGNIKRILEKVGIGE